VEIGGAFGSRLDDLEGILHEVIAKWESDQSEMAQRLSHLQSFQPDQLKDFNERLGRIEESFLKVSDQVRHIDSTIPEIESLEAHFTQLREQVASAQAELRRNNQGVVEIGGAFGSRLDDLEGILHEVIAKWESDQSEMAQRLSHQQGFQPDQLKDFNERLGRIEESFLKVSDQVRHIDSTTPETESLEAHFTQLREQVASAQAELRRNSQGVAEIGGAFGSRLDDLEGILQQVITRWDSGDQLQTGQRIRHLPSVQPAPLTEHKQNSQEVTDLRDAFRSRLDELEGILQRGLAKWGSDQLELAQAINTLQGFHQDPLNDANFQQAGHLEPMKPVTVYAKQHPVFYRPNHFEKTFNGQPVAYWQSQVPPVNESENVLQMTILAFKSCVVGVLVTCMVVLGAMMFFVLQKKGHTS
jgi:DNA repair exonuclease SbcCD ATPase subunit